MVYIYGIFPVLEAIRAKSRNISCILIARGPKSEKIETIQKLSEENNIPIRNEAREHLTNLVKGANHQGVVALAKTSTNLQPEDLLDDLAPSSLFIVLDQIEDPHNLGAIIRTAECAGVTGLFIPEHRTARLTDTVAKVSAGATEYLPIAQTTNLVNLIKLLKRHSIWVVGIEADGEKNYTEWDYNLPTAIILGSEGRGLRRLVRESCDLIVSIPLLGKIPSLNVSVAAGIILYEAVRQKSCQSMS